jgi:hypothetical protein
MKNQLLRWIALGGLAAALTLSAPPARGAQTPAPPPSPSEEEERDLKDKMVNLVARGVAVIDALETLERRLKRQGLSLRTDIIAERVKLEFGLDDAEAAMKERKFADAKRAMKRAESALERIEAFLGGK